MGEVEGSLLPVALSWLCLTLLCRAAEAVLQGRADSILTYHQQNVPRAKLDQVSMSLGPGTGLHEQWTGHCIHWPISWVCLCLLAGPQSAAHPGTTTPEHAVSRHPSVPASSSAATATPSSGQRPSCSAF